jgi:hypothetical protein
MTPRGFDGVFGPDNNIEMKFRQEFGFASHVKREGLILVELGNNDPVTMGKLLEKAIRFNQTKSTVVVEIPIIDPKVLNAAHRSDVQKSLGSENQVSLMKLCPEIDVHLMFPVAQMAQAP